jgi:hypothetical protein
MSWSLETCNEIMDELYTKLILNERRVHQCNQNKIPNSLGSANKCCSLLCHTKGDHGADGGAGVAELHGRQRQ